MSKLIKNLSCEWPGEIIIPEICIAAWLGDCIQSSCLSHVQDRPLSAQLNQPHPFPRLR